LDALIFGTVVVAVAVVGGAVAWLVWSGRLYRDIGKGGSFSSHRVKPRSQKAREKPSPHESRQIRAGSARKEADGKPDGEAVGEREGRGAGSAD
jgi:hypothetical protein